MASASVRCRLCGEHFRLITHTHLSSRHRLRGPPAEAYKTRYGPLWSGAALRAMSASLTAHHDRRGRKWTRDRIIRGIRRLGSCLRFRDVWSRSPELYWTAQRLFGSWAKALRAAAVPEGDLPRWPGWTRVRVLEEIRLRAKSGLPLHWSAVGRDTPALYWAGQRLLGSWRAALRSAGVDPVAAAAKPRWTRETVAAEFRRRKRRGRSLVSTAVRREHCALYKAALRLFGGWRAAIR